MWFSLCLGFQASAAQSGEQIMQYGQLIDDIDDENTHGQIPHLLGQQSISKRSV